MNLIDRIFVRFFHDRYMEAYFLDDFLKLFTNGLPKSNVYRVSEQDFTSNQGTRVIDRLVEDGHLKELPADTYIITSKGLTHLGNGGYRKIFIKDKLDWITLFLGIFASVVSLIAFIRTL